MDEKTRVVILTQGRSTVINEADWPLVRQFRWDWHQSGRAAGYARAYVPVSLQEGLKLKRRSKIYLHRLLLGPEPVEIDHIDGNGLNNRRSNLRAADSTTNKRNKGKKINNTSGYKGVILFRGKWRASLFFEGHTRFLGHYEIKEEAALAYDLGARGFFGCFANLNLPLSAALPLPLIDWKRSDRAQHLQQYIKQTRVVGAL